MGAFLRDIVRILDTIAPPTLAEPWDNVGLQLGDPGLDVKTVWVALDASPAVIRRAAVPMPAPSTPRAPAGSTCSSRTIP